MSKVWQGNDAKAEDLASKDGSWRVNSKNDYFTFIKTKETPKGWFQKSKLYQSGRAKGSKSYSQARRAQEILSMNFSAENIGGRANEGKFSGAA